jgi:hypothetical protein
VFLPQGAETLPLPLFIAVTHLFAAQARDTKLGRQLDDACSAVRVQLLGSWGRQPRMHWAALEAPTKAATPEQAGTGRTSRCVDRVSYHAASTLLLELSPSAACPEWHVLSYSIVQKR